MKANQQFRNEDEAVSPVIGVILMVAITVVLAAVVFVLVSDLGGGGESAPAISFSKNEGSDRLEIVSADPDADWNRLAIRVTDGTCATATDTISAGNAATDYENTAGADAGAQISAADCAAGTNQQVSSTVQLIQAGDFIEFCVDDSGGASTAASNVAILVTDTTANAKVWDGVFSTIDTC